MKTIPPLPSSTPPDQRPREEVPTVEIVDRLVTIADPVIRNLQITQSYCELSQALSRFVGNAANWCTYATWASKQAGVTIRQEDLARLFERLPEGSPEVSEAMDRVSMSLTQVGAQRRASPLRPTLRHILDPRVTFARTSDAFARGNLKVRVQKP
jgi:hypothetical protein